MFDVYHPNSLKHVARHRRGKGVFRRRVEHKVPNNWHGFLSLDDNKTELFHYIADEIKKLTKESNFSSDKKCVNKKRQIQDFYYLCHTVFKMAIKDFCSGHLTQMS